MSDWVVRLIEQSGYLGVAFLMFLETVFPPIPSEVIMPVAGVAGDSLAGARQDTAPRLYVETLNQMIDQQTVRVAALNNRIPSEVLALEEERGDGAERNDGSRHD